MAPTPNTCQHPTTGPILPLDIPELPHGLATGRDIPIAVIDTGAANPGTTGDRDHCLLHGTAVASVLKEVAPRSHIHSIRHSPHVDRAEGTVEDLIHALNRAREHKAKVINISMVACEDLAALREAIAKAQDAGALVVSSIGNRGQCEEGTMPFPASVEGVIAVGAIGQRDKEPAEGSWDAGRVPADYSAPGPWADLYAPGGPVSAQLHIDGKVHTVVGDPNPFLGTSFAAPVVSGTAALVWEILPSSDATLVSSIMLDTATHGGAVPGSSRPLLVIDPQAAVERALEIRAERASKPINEATAMPLATDLSTTVDTAPKVPDTPSYVVPASVAVLVCVVLIVALVVRALASDRSPASGSMDSTLHGA